MDSTAKEDQEVIVKEYDKALVYYEKYTDNIQITSSKLCLDFILL